ncbi:MAG: hypothetical protein A6F70_07440 [Cycloclasticus sp. symbiont of Bathymodiolus heckerae]|nr:MAG: hypothetical protein A6F70_07440 [Cycloclasticus sp. symbiont of Bathymodiolus heckerae]
MNSPTSLYSVDKLIEQARQLAADFKRMTGKPLPGVSNEIAEHDAAKFLDLELSDDRTQGFDATRVSETGPQKLQIKARTIFNDNYRGQRLGQLKLDKSWDSVVLVLMDENYQAFEIFEALRDDVINNLNDNSSRMKRGAMSVAKFRNIATLVWTKEDGLDMSAWRDQL